VTVSPTVEVSPSTQVHVVGDSTTVECRASGRPQPRRKSTWSATARQSSAVRRVDLNHDASPRGRRQHDGRVSCVGSTSTTHQLAAQRARTTLVSLDLLAFRQVLPIFSSFRLFVTNRPVDTKIASLQLLSHIGRTLYVDAAY